MQNQQAAQEWLLAVAQIGFILFLLVAIVLVAVLVIRTGVGSMAGLWKFLCCDFGHRGRYHRVPQYLALPRSLH